MAKLFGFCVLKGSELKDNDPRQKFRYRVVFQGNQVVDENWESALNTFDLKYEVKPATVTNVSSGSEDEEVEREDDTESNADDEAEAESESVGHELLKSDKLFKRPKRPVNTKHSFYSLPTRQNNIIKNSVDMNKECDEVEEDNIIRDQEGRIRTRNVQPVGFDRR